MDKNNDKIRTAVISSLKELIDENDTTISDNTKPIAGLGLMSDDGLDFACTISEKLGFNLDDKINPFINDVEHRERNVEEIITLIAICREEAIGATNE